MLFYNRFRDGKPQAAAAGLPAPGTVNSVETLKNMFLIFHFYSVPGIVDQELLFFCRPGKGSEILKSFANEGLDYRHFVSYYRGRDKKKVKEDGAVIELETEIDLIIEENGVLYPIEIKKNTQAKAIMTASFDVLDKIPGKKRGMGAVVCNCPDVGALRENILQIPVWYI